MSLVIRFSTFAFVILGHAECVSVLVEYQLLGTFSSPLVCFFVAVGRLLAMVDLLF